MSQINTVRGPIDAHDLGVTLMHEHLFVKDPELEANYPSPEWDEEAMLHKARAGLNDLATKGVSTLVDLTVTGLGRDISRIQRVADSVAMNIVVATGYYTMKDLPRYFRNHGPGLAVDRPDPLPEMFLRDIREGIATTGVKAAMIKVVTDSPGITDDIGRILRAAAHAHHETGVPITTHTNVAYRTGLDQQRFFREHGVDLRRVLIGHCGDATDLDYLQEIMDAGSTIGMDRFGMISVLPDEDRIATVAALCAKGYAESLTLSHDASFFSITSEPSHRAASAPNWHHHNISDRILPELRQRGVTEQQITQMMVVNPVRVLTGDAEVAAAVAANAFGRS